MIRMWEAKAMLSLSSGLEGGRRGKKEKGREEEEEEKKRKETQAMPSLCSGLGAEEKQKQA